SNSEHKTDGNESGSESDQDKNEEDEDDEEEVKDELVKTLSNDSDDEDETKITDKAKGDEDEEMDYITSLLYDDKTEVSVTSSSHSSDLAAKILNFSDIPHTDAEIVSLMDVHVHHEVPSQQTYTLLIVPVLVISDSSLNIFSTYGKVYSLKRSQKDKDEDPSAGSNRGLKKRKTGKDAAPTTGCRFRYATRSRGDLGNDDEEPKEKVASKHDWFTKPTQPQEPTDPDSNVDKTSQQGQNQSWLMTFASSAEKPLKTFDELMSTLIDFSAFIMNGLKINNLTPRNTVRTIALSEKLDWENLEGDDYPFDLTKPLPLVMSRNRQKVLVDYFFNNDLKYLQGDILTMTYMTSLTKTKAAQYDLPSI
ncbi:hypothetical protein Tco_0814367, partial [Tanacetum coccineum]